MTFHPDDEEFRKPYSAKRIGPASSVRRSVASAMTGQIRSASKAAAPSALGLPADGRLAMRTPTGEDVYEAGQVFYWPAGHAPRALEDVEYVDFSPTQEFAAVIRHITGGNR